MTTNIFRLLAIVVSLFAGTYHSTIAAQNMTVTEKVFDRAAHEDNFAFGADISWLSQQESWKTYYCNKAGKRTELMKILQEDYGLNAVRFRVWVNPSGGWSGKQDVINLCKRAHAKGLKIMISFHYSDTWADSKSQTIPAQWTDHSAEALAKQVYDHTYDVLKALHDLDIHPKWVAIGNETKYGMLYDTGRTKTTEGVKNFVRFINSAYQAIQDVDPSMLAVIHLPNAHDEATARKMFDNLQKYGAKYDVIGLSAYPRWSHLDVSTDANIANAINTYMTTFRNLKSRFKKPVMVVETGHYCERPLEGNRFLAEFMKALIADGEIGCFYWEPEAFENSGYNLGAWNSKTHQATIAMDAYLGVKHTAVNKYATTSILSPTDTLLYAEGASVEFKVYAKTTTKLTSVKNVCFFLNDSRIANLTPQGEDNCVTYTSDTLPTGHYRFHAVVTDTQGHSLSTDTLFLLVGNVAVFQENEDGFEGCSDTSTSITHSFEGYTGDGYVPASSDSKNAVRWRVYFPEAGEYTFFFRYHTEIARTTRLLVGTKRSYISCKPSPVGRWAYASKKITIEAPGVDEILMQGLTTDGFPDIDFLAIASPQSGVLVSANHETTDIKVPCMTRGMDESDLSGCVYDLAGRCVAKDGNTGHLKPGIYVRRGKKVQVK